MNKIITIGREFGSGGREVGKRLAELLNFAYYDKEIVTEIAKRSQLAEEYVQQVLERRPLNPIVYYPITTARTLHEPIAVNILDQQTTIYQQQNEVIRDISSSDCVIVGRCADYILRDRDPLRIFVYADMESKMKRCREKAEADESLSDKELKRQMSRIDKERADYYRLYTGQKWGDKENYDLFVNTSRLSVKNVAKALSELL